MDDGCGTVRMIALALVGIVAVPMLLTGGVVLWLAFGKRLVASMIGIE